MPLTASAPPLISISGSVEASCAAPKSFEDEHPPLISISGSVEATSERMAVVSRRDPSADLDQRLR